MAKRNVQNNKEVVQETAEKLDVSTGTTAKADQPEATPVPGTAAKEGVQEVLPVLSEQNSGEQTDGAESSELDSESEAGTNGAEGNEIESPIGEPGATNEPEEVTEKRDRIAKDVFEKNSNCKVLYFTADLVPFFAKSDALRHGANALNDDTIVTINRK